MPAGLGFSPAFSSYTVFTLLSTGASGSSRLKPSCPGTPVELNASFLVPFSSTFRESKSFDL